nr:hypothetical protein [uncultured Rhodopila sp.]
MKTRNRKARRGWRPALFACAAALAAGLTLTLASTRDGAMPKVGDIVVFAPGDPHGDDGNIRIAVHRPGLPGCVLDLDAIRQTGGSLVVEARVLRPVPGFRLHWAGERTSNSAGGDCGNSADLFLGKGDLGSLATAAGGYGLSFDRSARLETTIAD